MGRRAEYIGQRARQHRLFYCVLKMKLIFQACLHPRCRSRVLAHSHVPTPHAPVRTTPYRRPTRVRRAPVRPVSRNRHGLPGPVPVASPSSHIGHLLIAAATPIRRIQPKHRHVARSLHVHPTCVHPPAPPHPTLSRAQRSGRLRGRRGGVSGRIRSDARRRGGGRRRRCIPWACWRQPPEGRRALREAADALRRGGCRRRVG